MKREVEQVGRFEAHKLPSGEVVYFDPEPHRYYTAISPSAKSKGGFAFKRGSQMTGVSTPTKCLDTNVDPLLWWAAKLDQTGIADLATIELDAGGDLEWLREQASIAAALREAGLTGPTCGTRRRSEAPRSTRTSSSRFRRRAPPVTCLALRRRPGLRPVGAEMVAQPKAGPDPRRAGHRRH